MIQLFLTLLIASAWSATVKTTFQSLVQCPQIPYLLKRTKLDIAPKFSIEVRGVIGVEACKLTNRPDCQAYVDAYPSEAVEFRRNLEDYEHMFVHVALRFQTPLSDSEWSYFKGTLMSPLWLQEVTEKIHVTREGACISLTDTAYPQQSGNCWSYDLAVNHSSIPNYQTSIQNEFCSIRLTHEHAQCLLSFDGINKAKRVSMATFDYMDCANQVAEDPSCGASFSFDQQSGACLCSTPGFICNGAHESLFSTVYEFRSGTFEYVAAGDEESEGEGQANSEGGEGGEEGGESSEGGEGGEGSEGGESSEGGEGGEGKDEAGSQQTGASGLLQHGSSASLKGAELEEMEEVEEEENEGGIRSQGLPTHMIHHSNQYPGVGYVVNSPGYQATPGFMSQQYYPTHQKKRLQKQQVHVDSNSSSVWLYVLSGFGSFLFSLIFFSFIFSRMRKSPHDVPFLESNNTVVV